MLFENRFVINQAGTLFHKMIVTLTIFFVFLSVNNLFAAQAKITFTPVSDSRIIGYKIYYGKSTHTINMVDIGNRSSYTVSNLKQGATYYFTATSYDRYGNESQSSNIVAYEVPRETTIKDPETYYGKLEGRSDAVPDKLDLSLEGLDDWAHWGLHSASCLNRKNGTTQQIGDFYLLGNRMPKRFTDARVAYSWFDGKPSGKNNLTTTGIYFRDVGNGYEIAVPADVYNKTLKIYLGAFRAGGQFEAFLTDGSAAPYSTYIENKNGVIDRVITLNFAAAEKADLIIRYVLENDYRNKTYSGNITLQAVTLY